jgi:hypothetical protein
MNNFVDTKNRKQHDMERFTPDDDSSLFFSQCEDKYHHHHRSLILGQPLDVESEAAVELEDENLPKSQHEQREPIVSILNLVVDYVMTEPSPLEPDEFRWKLMNDQKQGQLPSVEENTEGEDRGFVPEGRSDGMRVQVPVIRIFGPIIRGPGMSLSYVKEEKEKLSTEEESSRDDFLDEDGKGQEKGDDKRENYNEENDDTNIIDIHQSGCLHVHGVFPYMIARPVEAGPDASADFNRAYQRANDEPKEGDHEASSSSSSNGSMKLIDWDDADSVAMITDEIHCRLEEALQSYMMERNNNNCEVGDERSLPTTRFIRQITVVQGRGFYTFCNGAVAPFLRVEYYNPSHRWRVKIMLERGLEVPMEYLPQHATMMRGANNHKDDKMARADDNRATYFIHGENVNEEESSFELGLLKFRCYEAHIPYTMQFFKVCRFALFMPL